MNKITTLQKLVGFALLLSLFPIVIGVYAVNSLSTISSDLDSLYSVQVRVLHDQPPGVTITSHLPTENPEEPKVLAGVQSICRPPVNMPGGGQ